MKKFFLFLFFITVAINTTFSQPNPIFHISAEHGLVDLAGGRFIDNIGNVSIEPTPWGGKAFLFNGNNYLQITDDDNLLDFKDQFTIEIIVRTNISQYGIIISKGDLHTYPKNIILGLAPFINGHWFNWGVEGRTSSGPVYQLGQYEKAAFICKNDSIYYVSGSMDNGLWIPQPGLTDLFHTQLSDEPFRIGAGFSTAPDPIQARYFSGEVVEVKVYNQALEPSEITPFDGSSDIKMNQGVDEQDSLALVGFYHATNGDEWHNNENWLTGQPVSTWYGIGVENGRVSGINLCYNNLNGTIPQEFYDLTALRHIYLCGEGIQGQISSAIGVSPFSVIYCNVFNAG